MFKIMFFKVPARSTGGATRGGSSAVEQIGSHDVEGSADGVAGSIPARPAPHRTIKLRLKIDKSELRGSGE